MAHLARSWLQRAIRGSPFLPPELERAVDDSPAQIGFRRWADPPRPSRRRTRRVLAPDTWDQNRRADRPPGGSRSSVRPRTLNARAPGWQALVEKPAQRGTNQSQGQRPIDHLEPIKQHLELLIRSLQLPQAPGHRSTDFALEEVKTHLDAVERVAATVIEAAQHLAEACQMRSGFSTRRRESNMKAPPPPVLRAVADSWCCTWCG